MLDLVDARRRREHGRHVCAREREGKERTHKPPRRADGLSLRRQCGRGAPKRDGERERQRERDRDGGGGERKMKMKAPGRPLPVRGDRKLSSRTMPSPEGWSVHCGSAAVRQNVTPPHIRALSAAHLSNLHFLVHAVALVVIRCAVSHVSTAADHGDASSAATTVPAAASSATAARHGAASSAATAMHSAVVSGWLCAPACVRTERVAHSYRCMVTQAAAATAMHSAGVRVRACLRARAC